MERKIFEIIENALADRGYTILDDNECYFIVCSPDDGLCCHIMIDEKVSDL